MKEAANDYSLDPMLALKCINSVSFNIFLIVFLILIMPVIKNSTNILHVFIKI